jgi:drug/metabolite transporter (DMT)-like permease
VRPATLAADSDGARGDLGAVSSPPARPALIGAGLACIYLVWGSTYLAIRVAVRTMPPFAMASVRFLLAGALLYAVARRRAGPLARPTRHHWAAAFVVGSALLAGGNGLVTWSEQRIPSGHAALLIATVPLWMAVLDHVWNGVRLTRPVGAGLVLGFAGVALLARPAGGVDGIGSAVVVLAALSWAWGSLRSRSIGLHPDPLLASAMQMLGGSLTLGVAALVTGEGSDISAHAISRSSVLALAWLVIFGAIVAFTAYAWLLRNAPTSLVGTYAYVNPVVAVFLGAALLGETITARTLVGGAVIVAAVVLIVASRRRVAV